MRRTRFDHAHCPVARTADLLGDWWTPLVLRELLLGRRRFNDVQRRLGISRAVLAQRFERLVDEDVVERRQYQDRPPRYEYHLTDKGRALVDVVVAMWQFGDDWMFDDGAQVELVDVESGNPVRTRLVDIDTGAVVDPARLRVRLRRPTVDA